MGEPLEGGWFISGAAGGGDGRVSVDVNWSISGPDGDGTVLVDATQSDGEWDYHSIVFEFDDGAEINLLE